MNQALNKYTVCCIMGSPFPVLRSYSRVACYTQSSLCCVCASKLVVINPFMQVSTSNDDWLAQRNCFFYWCYNYANNDLSNLTNKKSVLLWVACIFFSQNTHKKDIFLLNLTDRFFSVCPIADFNSANGGVTTLHRRWLLTEDSSLPILVVW